jgi:hypothetical protein
MLILKPLRKIDDKLKPPSTIIIVIDALDECEQHDEVRHILKLLPLVKNLLSFNVKFFVTSRPEDYICEAMKDEQVQHQWKKSPLHEEPETADDISAFIGHRLEEIRDHLKDHFNLPAEWPGAHKITGLVQTTVPLFIFAATACRFIEDRRLPGTPTERLDKILRQETWDYKSKISATYLPTLDQMVHQFNGNQKNEIILEFKAIVGPIILLARPLSTNSLAALLGISFGVVRKRLNLLHSILNVPTDPEALITLFHQSFRDFLLSPELAVHFSIRAIQVHEELKNMCLVVMENLAEDICCQGHPGRLQRSIDKQEVNQYLTPELQYACLYWVDHLQKSGYEPEDDDPVHDFLQRHLLHWFEALGWMGKVSDGIQSIFLLESIISVSAR